MTFKRYGGTFTGSDGGGNHKVSMIGMFILVIGCAVFIFTENAVYLIGGFIALMGFTIISLFVGGGATSGIRQEKQRELLQAARQKIQTGDMDAAKSLIERAKIYGRFPEDYNDLE